MLGARIAQRRQVDPRKERLTTAEQHRRDRDMHLVDEPRLETLAQRGRRAADLDRAPARGLPGATERFLNSAGDEMKDGPAFHRDRFARVVRQHEHRHVIRRVLAPPAAPPVVGPRPAHGAEHVSAHDIRTDAFPEALGKIVVGTRRPARFSVYLTKRARADVPAVQLLTTHAEWVLQSLVGAGAVPVERDREVVDAQLGHGILLWFSYASNGPSRNRQANDGLLFDPSLLLLVQQHPRRPKPVAQHREPVREKRLLHFHEDLTTLAEQRVEPLRLLRAIHPQRQIRTAHRLGARDVRAHEDRFPNLDARVQDRLLPVGGNAGLIRLVLVRAHHRDLAAEVAFVEPKGGCARPGIIDVDVELHLAAMAKAVSFRGASTNSSTAPRPVTATPASSSPRLLGSCIAISAMTAVCAKLDQTAYAIKLRCADGLRAASTKKTPSVARIV